MKINFNSINLKVSLAATITILFFGSLAVVGTYFNVINKISTQTEIDYKNIVENASHVIEQDFNNASQVTQNISIDESLIKFFETNKPSKKLVNQANQLLSKYNIGGNFLAIYLVDTQGNGIASTDESFIGQNYSYRQYFLKSISGIAYSDVNYGTVSKQLGYYFSRPVLNSQNQIIGIAVAKLNPEVIKTSFNKLIVDSISNLMLVDHYGVVVESNRPERIFQSLGQLDQSETDSINQEKKYLGINLGQLQYQPVLGRLRSKPQNTVLVDFKDPYDHQDEKVILTPIIDTNFYLVSEINSKDVTTFASQIATFIVVMVGLAAVSALILLIWFISVLLSPIGKLSKMARNISSGNFNVDNPVESHDEFFVLGDLLKNMAFSISNKYQELEAMVQKRTDALKTQTDNLSNSQIAIQNLLEDTNIAKNKAEIAVNDLEKFKQAVENASDHIIITDPEGIIIYANAAATKLTGFSLKEMVGKKAGTKELWGGQMPKIFYEKMWQTIKIEKKYFKGEVVNHHKNGEKYIAMASISPVLDQKGEVVFFIGIERDATVEKEIDRMKTEFISLASHQLRTPLSSMKWFSEMLLSGDAGKLNQEQTEFVTNIYNSNQRMIDLVKDLLDISRIESGRIIVEPVPTDVPKLISEIITEIQPKINEKNQEIITKIDKKIPLVNLDPNLIRNVFLNLLTNANKYSPIKGKITITVSIKEQLLYSEVSDSGFGIPKNEQNKIFDKFFRASNITKKETEGTGLGLYIAKSVVESSGGNIGLNSIEDKGSTFWFTLPLKGVSPKKGEVSLGS